MAKKISHKEVRRRMKMNELLEAEHWLERFWRDHQQKITWGIAIVAVLTLGFYLYSDWKKKSRSQAFTLYGEALRSSTQEQYDEALPLVNQVIEQFSSAPAYPFALMLKGDILFAQGEIEQALQYYQQVARRRNPDLAPAALLAIAACHESLERHSEAEEAYNQILKTFPKAAFSQQARFLLARLLETQGKSDQAIAMYKDIPSDSVWAEEAQKRIAWLEAPVIALPTTITEDTPS